VTQQKPCIDEVEASEVARRIAHVGNAIVDARNILCGGFHSNNFQLGWVHIDAHYTTSGTHPSRQFASYIATTATNIHTSHAWAQTHSIQKMQGACL
jgi:hypothetical protein